ncbi:MAG TPA: AraC family transcriptional regulator [Solimonas sp.]|nr:AraC family transcriptional regulator [Solimonas sp.]
MTVAHYLPARYYALLASRLLELGVDVPALLREAGVDPVVLMAPDGQLRPEQVERLAALAVTHSGRSDLGFELGRRLKLSSHDILGYAMLSAPTLDYALRLVARYFSLITPTYRMQFRSDGQRAEARFQPALPLSPRVLAFHLEAIAVAFHDHVKTLLGGGEWSCSIHLPFAAPPHVARYAELDAAVLHFGEEGLPIARMILPAAVTLRPLPMAEANAVQMAEQRCAQLLSTITAGARMGDWVQMMLREAAEGQPTLEEMARILNLSPRTLERRLAQEGGSFRAYARAARHARACELLRAGRLGITQIAYQLGYGDAANFTRAFRREAGCSPSEFRQRETAA